mgnify:CR=1 FL=1
MTDAPLPENPTISELEAFFGADRFATQAAGCRIVEGWRGHGVAEMELVDVHKNAMGNVMGGAIFTLADFALAIACNLGEAPTVSISNTIEFLAAPKGSRLTATADADRSGRRVGFYTVEVVDDTGRRVAKMCATCSR